MEKILSKEISFDLAKLLKEKRISIGGFKYYDNGGFLNHSIGFIYNNSGLVLAPTIAEVVDWIFEKYNIWISVDFDDSDWFQVITIISQKDREINGKHNTPLEAYEEAIKYVLENY